MDKRFIFGVLFLVLLAFGASAGYALSHRNRCLTLDEYQTARHMNDTEPLGTYILIVPLQPFLNLTRQFNYTLSYGHIVVGGYPVTGNGLYVVQQGVEKRYVAFYPCAW